jgi:quaternary ammonium compound-resistance protein SugE
MQGRPCFLRNLPYVLVAVLLAGLFEVAWAIGLKYTDGFSRPLPPC